MNHAQARKILGVDATADKDAIKAAYRKMAMKHHPDRPDGSEEKFKEISEALDVLQTPERSTYGRSFEDIFNEAFGKNAYNSAKQKADKERDFYYKSPFESYNYERNVQFNISLAEAFNGCTKNVNIDGLGVRKIEIHPGTIDNQRISPLEDDGVINGIKYKINVRVVAPEGTTIDWGLNARNDLGTVTIQTNISPFILMSGGHHEVEMFSGEKVKVYIPPGTKANTLLKVKGKGYWKNKYERADCLLRIIPEIKIMKQVDLEDFLNFSDVLIASYAQSLPADMMPQLSAVILERTTKALGLTWPETAAKENE